MNLLLFNVRKAAWSCFLVLLDTQGRRVNRQPGHTGQVHFLADKAEPACCVVLGSIIIDDDIFPYVGGRLDDDHFVLG